MGFDTGTHSRSTFRVQTRQMLSARFSSALVLTHLSHLQYMVECPGEDNYGCQSYTTESVRDNCTSIVYVLYSTRRLATATSQ